MYALLLRTALPPTQHDSAPPPLSINTEFANQLWKFADLIMEKIGPFLKLIGLYDSASEFMSSLIQSLSSRSSSFNSSLYNESQSEQPSP